MTSLATPEVMSSCGRDQDLARRRLQQKGDLFNQGGMWKLRWHEDKIGPDGELTRGWSRAVHIGPSAGPGKHTEKEARRLGWENFLSKLDAGVCAPPTVSWITPAGPRRSKTSRPGLRNWSAQRIRPARAPKANDFSGCTRGNVVVREGPGAGTTTITTEGRLVQSGRHVEAALA